MAQWIKNAQSFLLFISGVIVSAVVTAVLGHIIPVSEGVLMVFLVLALLGATFFVAGSSRRIEVLADRMETTVRYVEERYREQEGIPFQGIIYRELERLLSDARSEILVLATTSLQDNVYVTREHPARAHLLHAIEETIGRRHLVLIIDGVDSTGNPYAAGAFFIEDRGGRVVEHLLWNFDQIERMATSITAADLTPAS